MVAVVAAEASSGSVTDVFHIVRQRCPEWAVTPHRVRKALIALQNSRKKHAKQGAGNSRGSNDSLPRAYPHDVVELRNNAGRARHAQWQWRGQVLRVAGYDDGEATDDEHQELPPGHCSVFWLGHGLEQWPNALTKESSIKVLDRPWVLGDRVAKAEDARSLGTVVGVRCKLRFSDTSGSGGMTSTPEVPVQSVRAVGGFRAEDWVANDATRWVGKVEEAVFRVEVELCGKGEHRLARSKTRSKPAVCVFQVSSEGLQGLEPAGGEDVTPQELSPHFPGQRVRAPARLWRQAEWIRGSLGRRSPRRGTSICGVVSSVECCLLAVRWLAGAVKDSQPPDEWVGPEALRPLTVPNSSEGWAMGDHVQTSPDVSGASAVVVESQTFVDVCWADGTLEEDVPALKLCPRPHVSAHDFLPYDFVAKNSEGFSEMQPLPQASGNNANSCGQGGGVPDKENEDKDRGAEVALAEMAKVLPAETPLGVVTSVNLQARTAAVEWTAIGETEEVSVFELTDHPQVDVRLGDAVLLLQPYDEKHWAGRVCGLRADGSACVELLDGVSQWHSVRRLLVVDDSEGSEVVDDGAVSDGEGSTRSDAAASDASAEHNNVDERSDGEDFRTVLEWPEAREELEAGIARPQNQSARLQSEAGSMAVADVLGNGGSSVKETLNQLSVGEALRQGEGADVEANERTERDTQSRGPENSALAGTTVEASSSSGTMAEVLPFDVCDDDVEPLDHYFLQNSSLGSRALMMAVRREMVVLRKGLLEGSEGVPAPIIVRTFSSRSDLFRAMVVGPPETPYAYVPFFFDLALPSEYPREAPLAHFHAHYVGNERLNPNLYVDGKVCLSLLGTWSGPAWDPQRSTLLQVLVSLQGLVLVEEPYFNEPGHECDVGTEQGCQSSALYNEHARLLALRAALNVAIAPPSGFGEIVADFFARYGPKLVEQCEEALREPKASQSSEGFRRVLAKTVLPRLCERWGAGRCSG